MKKITLITLALALLALVSSCATKPQNNAQPPKTAENAAAENTTAGDGIFKYTITTDIDAESDDIEILVAMNSVRDKYLVKYDLDCEGDGDFEHKSLTEDKMCIYKKNSGTHQIWVRGEIPAMYLCDQNNVTDENEQVAETVISIDSWGNIPWKSMNRFAAECKALNKLPEDSPDLSQVQDMSMMFYGAKSFNQPLEKWNTANVTNMARMFLEASSFNQPLEKWNTANVTNMSEMFSDAKSFNQPLEKWNTANVTNMRGMFTGAESFNQPIEAWDVSNVADMSGMFCDAGSFNQPLEAWNTANVTNMSGMFTGASSFNQSVQKWNISKVTNMTMLFYDAHEFSYYPKSWVVPAKTSDDMFTGTKVEEDAKKSPLKTK